MTRRTRLLLVTLALAAGVALLSWWATRNGDYAVRLFKAADCAEIHDEQDSDWWFAVD